MVNETLEKLKKVTKELNESILLDIEDVKQAKHENLLKRNDLKLELMEVMPQLKEKLNQELSQEYENGTDISLYKEDIDELENKLKELYANNGKLASIVLPVKEMYKEIIDEITKSNGGTLVEVIA